jgi:mevalonate kinase
MKVSVNKGFFDISFIEMEMMQNIFNGFVVQKEKYEKQIDNLYDCLKQNNTVIKISDYNKLLEYICEKHKELENIIGDYNKLLDDICEEHKE